MSSYDAEWFGDCCNTFHEEQKQLVYASRMGLVPTWLGAHPPSFNAGGTSIIDIGGGPVSLLLKTINRKRSVVMDPGRYPDWVHARYLEAKIEFWRQPGEELDGYTFDEAWIYNTLQHVVDPERVVHNALTVASTLRIFEWVDLEAYDGHPHQLSQEALDKWCGSSGFVAEVNQDGAVGRAYYGVFQSS